MTLRCSAASFTMAQVTADQLILWFSDMNIGERLLGKPRQGPSFARQIVRRICAACNSGMRRLLRVENTSVHQVTRTSDLSSDVINRPNRPAPSHTILLTVSDILTNNSVSNLWSRR